MRRRGFAGPLRRPAWGGIRLGYSVGRRRSRGYGDACERHSDRRPNVLCDRDGDGPVRAAALLLFVGLPAEATSGSTATPTLPFAEGPTDLDDQAQFCLTSATPGEVVNLSGHSPRHRHRNAPDWAHATVTFVAFPTDTGSGEGGGWQTFGLVKNQGDCVSFVATGGKNPPAG